MSLSQIKHNLRRNAFQLKTTILNQGYGRIDAFKSVQDTTALPVTVKTEGVVKGLVKVKFFPIYKGVYQIEYSRKILEPKQKGKLICKLDTRKKSSVPQTCNWNTRLLNDGLYSLRVTFTDLSGRKSQDTSLVLVRNRPNTYLSCETCLDCSLLLSWPGSSVNLTRDLTDFSKACVRISGDDTSFDCNQKEFKQNVNVWDPPGIFANSERVKIRNCKFTNMSNPLILFYPGKRITAENNLITNPVYGITLALVQNVSLVENKVLVDDYSFFRRGLYFLDPQTKLSQDSLLDYSDHSIDTSNTINGKSIYYLFNQYGTALSNLEVGGVFIRGGANNTIDNIRIVGGDGINIFASSNNRVLNNYLENNAYALTLGPKSNNNLIQSNIFKNYQFYAIVGENQLEEVSSVSNKIFDNSFILDFRDRYEASFVGIFFEKNFLNTEVRNNNFVNSLHEGVGIVIGAASGLIQGNRIQGQETGIALRVTSGFPLILRNNQIRSNKIGLRISYQSSPGDFIFQHNTIANNEKQIRASLSDSTLELSYQRQGNFWGRASPPLFCKPSNPHPSCSENPDSNSDQVVDSCPYDRDYAAGEWPQSPVCP